MPLWYPAWLPFSLSLSLLQHLSREEAPVWSGGTTTQGILFPSNLFCRGEFPVCP